MNPSREDLIRRIAEMEARLTSLDRQRQEAREEIEDLRNRLEELPPSTVADTRGDNGPGVPPTSAEKVRLFRSLFRGRAGLAAVPDDEERLVLATGRYIGEGFDDARLDTLFLAMPVSWKGTLAQYTGRLHRLHPGKTEVRIFDYVDRDVPILLRMFEKRLRAYRAIGYGREDMPPELEPTDERKIEYDEEALRHFGTEVDRP